jgi:cytidylate kinase
MPAITITGDLGSGKSAVSRQLCHLTGYEYVSTGKVQRQLAAELGIDTLELNRLADSDPSIDERIDGIFKSLASSVDNYVVDSRLAWFFLPDSFKVYLAIQPEEAVRRIMSDPERQSESYQSAKEAMDKVIARKHSENARFWKTYGADCTNMQLFHLVIDTTSKTPVAVAERILQGRTLIKQGIPFSRYW